ncbi:MAG TPA: hypothetical protein VGE08_18070 [Steroidobacter sp.]|uniref:hypothetical protein n=1 Tax=Steroidobacter sp. TaxID=1978227 RepID=UPI002EDBB630
MALALLARDQEERGTMRTTAAYRMSWKAPGCCAPRAAIPEAAAAQQDEQKMTVGNSFEVTSTSRSYAPFNQTTIRFIDHFAGIIDLRYTHDEVSASTRKVMTPGPVAPFADLRPVFASTEEDEISGKLQDYQVQSFDSNTARSYFDNASPVDVQGVDVSGLALDYRF